MKAKEFCFWLEGFIHKKEKIKERDMKEIRMRLIGVTNHQITYESPKLEFVGLADTLKAMREDIDIGGEYV